MFHDPVVRVRVNVGAGNYAEEPDSSAVTIGCDRALLSDAAEINATMATSAATTPATAPIADPYSLIQSHIAHTPSVVCGSYR